jgi:micrococcal nuclease
MTWIRNKFFVAVVTLILFLCSASYGYAFSGKCIRVTDGETIVVLRGNDKIKIRLYGVDCPEIDQRYGKKAKIFTSEHVLGKTLRIEEMGKFYNRIVGIVYANDFCLNSTLLKSGYALLISVQK